MLAAVLGALALVPVAAAAPKTTTYRSGPIDVGPYQVRQSDIDIGIPTPDEDGYVTKMEVDIVDADGSKVPIKRLMLHHIVFSNLGTEFGEKRDGTCANFTALDSRTQLPGIAERFYAAGEERAKLRLPEGYGYPVDADDRWGMTWMVMNHRNRTDRAYIQYRVTTDTARKTPVTPYWLDVRNCLTDPVFDVPGGAQRGSTFRESAAWTVPESGRIVAGGGHVHGGARDLTLRRGDCRLYSSTPTWGTRNHPFYRVKPILHEPGPIDMSGFTSEQGFGVRRGDRLRMDANYEGSQPHTRVMGIMLVYLAPEGESGSGARPDQRSGLRPTPEAAQRPAGCRRPADLQEWRTRQRGRRTPPRFTVPITGLGPDGRAREISKPPGRRVRVRDGARIEVGDSFFGRPNVAVRAGSRIRWDFEGSALHNITVANGPRGFSSAHLNDGRQYRKRLSQPGTYRYFCGLHPVSMTGTITVAKRRGR